MSNGKPGYILLEEYIKDLYKIGLRSGINVFDFWEMTIAEVLDTVEAFNDSYNADAQFKAVCAYKSGYVASHGMSGNTPSIYEVFPSLFPEPKPVQQSAEIMKARMLAYNEALKRQNKNKGR